MPARDRGSYRDQRRQSGERAANKARKQTDSDDGLFFGTSPQEKQELRETSDPKKLGLDDLDLNAVDRERYDAPEKVGESLRLIDMAMGNEPGRPGRPGPRRPGRPGPRRPGRPGPRRAPQARGRPVRPTGKPQPRRTQNQAFRPGGRPAQPGRPPGPGRRPGQPGQAWRPGKPGRPGQPGRGRPKPR